MARKKQVIRKTIHLGLRISPEEQALVVQKARAAGMSVSAFARKLLLHGQVKAFMNEEEKIILRQLVGIANNVNQFTKKAHTEGVLTVLMEYEKLRERINEILNRFSHDK